MLSNVLAMAAPAGATEGQSAGGGLMSLVPFFLMAAVFYFAIIRPQHRREKERKTMMAAIKSGERVLLSSGLIGEVSRVKEKTLLVRIAEQTQVEVLKSAVAQIIQPGDALEDVKA